MNLCNRVFLVEAPCAMAPSQMPMLAKPRHLFLFSDLLLVAKPKNGGNFKLKVTFCILFPNNFLLIVDVIKGKCAGIRIVVSVMS